MLVLTAASMDDVTVAGCCAFVDNGIETSQSRAGEAGHAPECVGGTGEERHGGERSDGLHD